ncbi:MAG: carbon-nitrogen hydrolase family protein [Elainella sp.]
MKIAVAQFRPESGNISSNLARHEQLINLAASRQVELIVFPELSLTGYEPTLANDLATTADDRRFLNLQTLAQTHRMTICVGVPTVSESGIRISMLIFQPDQPVQVYSKRYLHSDEDPFFVPGVAQVLLAGQIAPAICYELSVPQHAEAAQASGAAIYLTSVAKTHSGVINAAKRLAAIAQQYGMTVFMANCIGPCDNSIAGGQSAVWNAAGELLASLSDTEEGLVAYDSAKPEMAAEVTRCIAGALEAE